MKTKKQKKNLKCFRLEFLEIVHLMESKSLENKKNIKEKKNGSQFINCICYVVIEIIYVCKLNI